MPHVQARVGKNAAALLLSQVGVRMLALVFNASLGRILGVDALGRYLTMLALEGLALAGVSLGLNIYATRELSRCEGKVETETLLGVVLGIRAIAGLMGTVLLIVLVAPWINKGIYRVHITVVSMALLPDAVIGVLGSLIRSRQRMELISGIELGARFISALSGIVMLWLGLDEIWALGAYVIGRVLAAMVLLGVLRYWNLRPRWNFGATWKKVLRESIPFAIADIVAILYRKFDVLLLANWHGDATAGIYGAAYSLWENLGLIPSSLLEALFPEMARRTQDGNLDRLRTLYHRGWQIIMILVLLMVVFFFFFAPGVFRVLYGAMAGRMQAANLFRWMLLGLPFTYLYLLDGNLLYAVNRQRQVTRWMVLVTLLNVVVNLVLIPRWGSWAAMGVAVFSTAMLFLALHREIQLVMRGSMIEAIHGS